MKTLNYQYLIGKEKKEVIEGLGLEFNYYHSEIWSYYIKTNWLGRKLHLFVVFKDDKVQKIKIC